MPRWAGTTTERGLGYAHQQERKRLLPLAYGKPCPICGQTMLRDQYLDLDHSVPRVLGGQGPRRITHRSCNRAAGTRLGNALRRSNKLQTSRRW